MYQLLTESKNNIQTYDISGTIGSVSISDANILRGSLTITNQCADESTFNLGGVYIGQMSCAFVNVGISRNDWIGKAITLSVTINSADTIPIGVFYVDSAEHTKGITKVTAYDAMSKFDKGLGANTSSINDSPFNILTWLCTQCGVTLGMTQAQVEALPNGTEAFFVSASGDIETYRDILYWISQTLGGFATIDRNGYLVIRTYHSTVDDTIDYDVRYNTSQYGDEIVKFSGFYWTFEETGEARYEHSTPYTDYYVTLGINPFLQTGLRDNYINGILSALGEIEYNDCNVSIPFGIHYDLGDVLQFTNGQGSATNKFCVVSYSWTYYGEYKIKSIAVPKTSKNKSDKNITALMRKNTSEKIQYYLIVNTGDVTISDGHSADIIDLFFASSKNTVVIFDAELHCDIETKVDGINYYDAIVQFTYFYNEVELTGVDPVETWQDGKHIKHLLYFFTVSDANINHLVVKAKIDGGDLEIKANNLRGAIYGQNLVAEEDWGLIKIKETVSDWNLIGITSFESATDDIDVSFVVNRRITEDRKMRVTQGGDLRVHQGV